MRTTRILNGNVLVICMNMNLVDDNMFMTKRAYLIITKIFHGPHILNGEHTYVEYILLAGTIAEYHHHNIVNIGRQTEHYR